MESIKKKEAIARLTRAVRTARVDDLVEIYNELFPEEPTTEKKANANPSSFVDKVMAHIANGLEIEEILALWNIIFPMHRGVWFDEDEELIHYTLEATDPVGQMD